MNVATLIPYRRQLEEALRIEVELLAERFRETEARRVRLESEADAKARAYLECAKSGILAGEALIHYAALEGLARAIRQATEGAAAFRAEWERKRNELVEAARERRKLEVLAERDRRRRRRAAEQQEQRLTDEVAGRRPSW